MQRIVPPALLVVAVLGLSVWAAKPPERIDPDIECTIFEALPLLKEAQPFLREVEVPENVDFKTRLAYTQDWNVKRAEVAKRFDALVRACDERMSSLGK